MLKVNPNIKDIAHFIGLINGLVFGWIYEDDFWFQSYSLLLTFGNFEMFVQSNLSPVRPFSPYPDEEDYMEVYFRLQRTDGFNAIIKGIK